MRAGSADDAAVLFELIAELAEYERARDAVEVTADVLARQLSQPSPPFEVLFAQEGGSVLGVALFFQSYSTWKGRPGLWLEELYVRPMARGRGIGSMLLGELGRLCCRRGYGRLELAALNWNELANNFYRARGAESMNEWTRWRFEGGALERLDSGRSTQ